MKQIINFIFFILNFEIIFSYFGPTLSPNGLEDKESSPYSREKDMGPCTCNLTSHCDYRCCCDTTCSEDIIIDWKKKGICIDNHNNIINDFMCQGKSETFNYNKKKATMLVKDHIFNIMCIEFDNSGDMEEYYLKEYNDDPEEIKNNWINSFFNIETETTSKTNYGRKIHNFTFYTRDLNGNCVDTQAIYCLKPFEMSCKLNKDFNPNDLNDNTLNPDSKVYGKGSKELEITYTLTCDNNGNYEINEIKTLKIDRGSTLTNFKIEWKNQNQNNDNKRSYPYGYQQGKPIKIAITQGGNPYYFYKKGFFIGISGRNGNCGKEIDNDVSFYPILFKNNINYNCRISNDYKETYIYKQLCNYNLIVGIAPNSSLTNDKDWKFLDNINKCQKLDNNKDYITFKLTILTSKGGKENSPYEFIQYAKLDINGEESTNKNIISFSVQFVDISYSSIINSKNGKITSYTLSNDLI